MATRSTPEDLASQAKFVFKGTVQRVGAATMAQVPAGASTAVVRVDEVLKATEMLAGWVGAEITVQLRKGERVHAGDQAIFYTEPWLYGDGLAVRSLGHSAASKAAGARRVEPTRDRELADRIESAELVVTGRVVGIQLPRAARSKAETGPTRGAPISEHAPAWQEAVVEIERVEKGRAAPKQVVVRFPASTDVRWAGAPKLRPGQEGVFILRRDDAREEARRERGRRAAVYTVVAAEDVQPPERAERVRDLVRPAALSNATRSKKRR